MRAARDWLRQSAASTDNVMSAIVEYVDQNGTLGEIADTLREVFGEHHENVVV